MRKTLGLFGYGNFGKFIHKHLSRHFKISVYDPGKHKNGFRAALGSEIIILSVPADSLEPLLKKIRSRINPSALVLDVASVKTAPIRLMLRHLKNPVLGTHPLFGPQSGRDGIKGLPIIICPARITKKTGIKVTGFLARKMGLRVIRMAPAEHDRKMAYVQGITHFMSRAMEEMDVPAPAERTKAFEKLIEMRSLLGGTSPALFRTIEKWNPYAAGMRKRFMSALAKIERRLGKRG